MEEHNVNLSHAGFQHYASYQEGNQIVSWEENGYLDSRGKKEYGNQCKSNEHPNLCSLPWRIQLHINLQNCQENMG